MIKRIGRRGKRLLKGDRELSEKVVSRGYCELADLVPQVICGGPLTPHHKIKRNNLESRNDESNCMCLCVSHHHFVEMHPALSRKMGWRIDSKSILL